MSNQNASENPIIFEYARRGYDGGTEREMIAHIENQLAFRRRQHAEAIVRQHAMATPALTDVPNVAPSFIHQDTVAPAPHKEPVHTRKKLLFQAAVMPFVELVLGVSGLIVTSMMHLSHQSAQPPTPAIMGERQKLLNQSRLTIRTSLKNIVSAPWTLTRICFTGAATR